MAESVTFPQSGDANDAEHFGSMIGRDNVADYVEQGFSFSYDSSGPQVTISTGKAFIMVVDDTATSSGDTILRVNRTVQHPQETRSLGAGTTNYIYLEPDFTTDDNADYKIYTDQSSASSNALYLGSINTSTDEVVEENRDPNVVFGTIDAKSDLNVPVYSDSSNAGSTEADVIYIDGTGSETEGLYVYDDTSWNLVAEAGPGLESTSVGQLQVDEGYEFDFTSRPAFSDGVQAGAGSTLDEFRVHDPLTVTGGRLYLTNATAPSFIQASDPKPLVLESSSSDGSSLGLRDQNGNEVTIKWDSSTGLLSFNGPFDTMAEMSESNESFTAFGALRAEADDSSLNDSEARDAPGLTLRGYYDSDSSTSVNTTGQNFTIDHQVAYNGSNGASTVGFRVGGTHTLILKQPENRVVLGNSTDLRISPATGIMNSTYPTNRMAMRNLSIADGLTEALETEDIGGSDGMMVWITNQNGHQALVMFAETSGAESDIKLMLDSDGVYGVGSGTSANNFVIDGSGNLALENTSGSNSSYSYTVFQG